MNLLKSFLVGILILGICLFSFANINAMSYDESFSDYYNVISKKDWDLAPGISESEIILNNDSSSRRQMVHLMKLDTNNPYTKAIASYRNMDTTNYGTADMLAQTTWIRDNWGLNVIGGMNTCLSWYNGQAYSDNPERVGEPLGVMLVDGQLLFDHSVGFPTCVVINSSDRPSGVDKVQMITVNNKDDIPAYAEQVIPCSSGYIVKNGVNQYSKNHGSDTAPRSVVGITALGEIIIFENDGRQAPFSEGMTMYELAEVMIAAGCTYACNCDGGGSSTFVSKRPGSTLTVVNSPSDGGLRQTTNGIVFISTAPQDGTLYNVHISSENTYYTPNSTVNFSTIATDMSGKEIDLPSSATWELSDDSFGTIDDGVFVSNGKVGTVLVRVLYEGEVYGETSISIVIPEISFKQSNLVLPYGEPSTIALNVTTNEGRNEVTTKEGDIILSLSNESMGSINGMVFSTTQDTSIIEGTLYATLSFNPFTTISATVKFGKASKVVYDFENDYELVVDYSLDGGTDKTGDTPANYYKAWHSCDQKIDMYYGYRNVAKNSGYSPVGKTNESRLFLVDEESGKVHSGSSALAFNFNATTVTMMGPVQHNLWFPEPIDLTDATSFGFWLYIPNFEQMSQTGAWVVRFVGMNAERNAFKSQDFKLHELLANSGVGDEGWLYVSMNPNSLGIKTMDYIHFYPNDASASVINPDGNPTFYLDDFTVDYSDSVIDRENPYFISLGVANDFDSVDEINGQVFTKNQLTIIAKALESTTKPNYSGLDNSSVKVLVDGQLLNSPITVTPDGKIAINDLILSNGVHTIYVEIKDHQGNIGSISRKLIINSNSNPVEYVPSKEYVNPKTGSLVYFNIVVKDLTKVSSLTTKIRLDLVNTWELDHMDVAYGFDYSYSVSDNNEAIITFTRNSSLQVKAGTVIASLPIRVWMTTSYLNQKYIDLGYVTSDKAKQDKYWVLTPSAMWQTDGVSQIHIITDVSGGIISYTDGSKETFSSIKYDITTEMNRYRNSKNAGDENFWQNKFSFHIHKASSPVDKAPTCCEDGYEGRTFCIGCLCEEGLSEADASNYTCDCEHGCDSVIDWGKTLKATGHHYHEVDGLLVCECGELLTGVSEDGKYYENGVALNGWINNSYYDNGTLLTGVNVIDDIAYDLGDGSSAESYTGFYKDDLGYRYYDSGFLRKGFVVLQDETYFFDDHTGYAYTTSFVLGDITYEVLNEKGLIKGGWKITENGRQYYYSLRYYKNTWLTIDGDTYYFLNSGFAATGKVVLSLGSLYIGAYEFDSQGRLIAPITGVVWSNDHKYMYYAIDGELVCDQLVYDGTNYYYARKNYYLITWSTTLTIDQTKGLLPAGEYLFDETGKLVLLDGPQKDLYNDNYLVFYKNGTRVYDEGLYEYNGNYYYVRNNGLLLTWGMHISKTNGLVVEGDYLFGIDGKMIQSNGPVVDAYNDSYLNFYIDGKRIYEEGLYEYDGDYYYVRNNGLLLTWGMYISKTNGLLPSGEYSFNDEGKLQLLDGPVADAYNSQYLNFYNDGIRVYDEGLYEYNGNYYYVRNNGLLLTWGMHISLTNGLVAEGDYLFGIDGKMVQSNGPVVDAYNDSYLNFYIDGKRIYEEGLYEYDGDYYYVRNNGLLLTWEMYISKTNGLVIEGSYSFGIDGKMKRD